MECGGLKQLLKAKVFFLSKKTWKKLKKIGREERGTMGKDREIDVKKSKHLYKEGKHYVKGTVARDFRPVVFP